MNNPLVTILVVVSAASFSISAHADFVGIFAGGSVWESSFTGDVQDGTSLIDIENDLGIDSSTSGIFYVAFEHPVPVLPNLRLQHTDLDVSGDAVLVRSIDFDGVSYGVGEPINSSADLGHTDATMYWELWDTVGELDLGLTARLYDGFIEIDSDTSGVSNEEFSAPIPMIYAKLGFKLPLTGLNASVSANAIDYSDYQLFDAIARLNYEAKFGLGAEVGYRVMELDVDDEDILANITADGFFAGVTYHF